MHMVTCLMLPVWPSVNPLAERVLPVLLQQLLTMPGWYAGGEEEDEADRRRREADAARSELMRKIAGIQGRRTSVVSVLPAAVPCWTSFCKLPCCACGLLADQKVTCLHRTCCLPAAGREGQQCQQPRNETPHAEQD